MRLLLWLCNGASRNKETDMNTTQETNQMTDNARSQIGRVIEFKWTVSRGVETYGYTICTLRDRFGEKLGRCNGGGYDMKGTSFGQYIQNQFQPELIALVEDSNNFALYDEDTKKYSHPKTERSKYGSGERLYGGCAHRKGGKVTRVSIDGACGINSVRLIFEAIGLTLKWLHETKNTDLYEIVEYKPRVSSKS